MKIRCDACEIEGYLQHISQNYYRARHYDVLENGRHRFEHHKQRFLNQNNPSLIDLIDPKTIDLNLNNNGFSSENRLERSSSSWLGHKPSKLAIPGSSPGDRTKH